MSTFEEIDFYDGELNDLLKEISRTIESLGRLSGDARAEKVSHCNQRIARAKQVLHSFKVELRELNKEEGAGYEKKAKKHQQDLTKLSNDLQWSKTEGDRTDLLAGHSSDMNPDQMSAQDLIARGKQVQDQSKNATSNMKRMVQDAQSVGQQTAVKLKSQTEQMQLIDADMTKIDENLHQAERQLRAFMRRMMTDKIILVFMCLIFCGLIAIIILHVVKPDETNFNVPDEILPNINGESDSETVTTAAVSTQNAGRLLLRQWG